ncbi:TPA: hypothetical protein DCL37_01230 [Candidatus Acetothermia bacterium]|nr:hypothetical protein [Candidatus Acetothermia bacterium]
MRPRIPVRHGEVSWGWEGGLLEAARKTGASFPEGLSELREEARRGLSLPQGEPVVASGHQPLPVHPGILLRQLFLAALPQDVARVWISVDSDAPGAISFPVPLRRRGYTHHELVLLRNPNRLVLAARPAPGQKALARAWELMEARLSTLKNQGILRRAEEAWKRLPPPEGPWPGWWEEAKGRLAGLAGVRVIQVSELAASQAFKDFVSLLLCKKEGFLSAYGKAVRLCGLPSLSPGELPFWRLEGGKRGPARAPGEAQLPRALTLTFFLRAVVCDFFLHGAGGAGYEPGVDLLFREVFGMEPPPWGWLSGTFLLPEPSGERRLPGRAYPFFLHDLLEVREALSGPLSAL